MTSNPITDASTTAQQQAGKKQYKKPTLAGLGSVKHLTQTGSSSMSDATTMMR